EWEAADGVFADAAEVEGAVVFDHVGDLGKAVGGAVLEVFDDATLWVQAEDEGIALWCGLHELGQTGHHLAHERVWKHSVEDSLAWGDERKPETIAAVRGNAVRKTGQVVDENVVLAHLRFLQPDAANAIFASFHDQDKRLVRTHRNTVGKV